MLRPAITNIEEETGAEMPRTLTVEYRSSTDHVYTFEVTDLPWEDDGPVAFCKSMEQGGETYSFAPDDVPDEVADAVGGRGYAISEA